MQLVNSGVPTGIGIDFQPRRRGLPHVEIHPHIKEVRAGTHIVFNTKTPTPADVWLCKTQAIAKYQDTAK